MKRNKSLITYSEPVFLRKHSAARSTASFSKGAQLLEALLELQSHRARLRCIGDRDAADGDALRQLSSTWAWKPAADEALWQISSIASSLPTWSHSRWSPKCFQAARWLSGPPPLWHTLESIRQPGWGAGFSDGLSKDKPVLMAILWYSIILPMELLTSRRSPSGGSMQRPATLATFKLPAVCVLQWEPHALSGDAVAWEGACTQPKREKHQLEKEYSYEKCLYSNNCIAIYLQK